MPHFRVDQVDTAVWEWVKEVLELPEKTLKGLKGMQTTAKRKNQALFDRLAMLENHILETNRQREKLLDLYLNSDFPAWFIKPES